MHAFIGLKNERLPIPFARSYEVAPNGNVYRNGKRLKTRWVSGADYASLYCDDGTRKSVNLTRVSQELFTDPGEGLSASFIIDRLGARLVPGWPRYAATPYGAVFCVDPPERGPGSGQCFRVNERTLRDVPYVTLFDGHRARKAIKVEDVVRMTWND
tara:strand:- start:371 stop:841 length:471 start_codon:yes stop_codon:yes gene_type:complete